MKASELKRRYLDFFIKKDHRLLPNVSLIPENDPSALFVNSGMHPLVPYLLGEPHPQGKRLVSNQRCLRTQDIESIGDSCHLTFFEMLGNWSLGDYWKKEVLEYSWEFLTKGLNLDPKKIFVSCFTGGKDAPRDEQTAKIWQSLGVSSSKIYFLGKKDNWWSVGETGPCGPDTEMFYDTGKKPCGASCQPGDNCGKYVEIWNDVFMEFNRLPNGKLEKLKQRNIDTGMGVERTTAILQGKKDVYQTELFSSLINQIEQISGKKYDHQNKRAMRVIADHLRAATFIIADGIEPSNVERGYVLRRLIRRAAVKMHQLGMGLTSVRDLGDICNGVVKVYEDYDNKYFKEEIKVRNLISKIISQEMNKFARSLDKGLKEFEKADDNQLNALLAFNLFQTYGFPLEVSEELFKKRRKTIDRNEFEKIYRKHQKLSCTTAKRIFKGGLAETSEKAVKYHTATHLLHQALREVLGSHIRQVGSNITSKRLRFDFAHSEKLTEKEIKKIEDLVNKKIKADLPVKMRAMSLDEARKKGALAFFDKRYGGKVKVYFIGDFSKEVCGGPHVTSLKKIGGVKIVREKSIGAGQRRIYAQLIEK